MEFDQILQDPFSRQFVGKFFVTKILLVTKTQIIFRLFWSYFKTMWQIKLGSTWCHFDWSNKYKLLWKRSSKFIHFVRHWLVTSGLHFRFPFLVENQVTENDKVIYNKAIDKRSRKERAINIRLRTDKITEKREKGTGFESHKKKQVFIWHFRYCRSCQGVVRLYQKGQESNWSKKSRISDFFSFIWDFGCQLKTW